MRNGAGWRALGSPVGPLVTGSSSWPVGRPMVGRRSLEGLAMTYRDRRAAKAERLREWADKREAKAESGGEEARRMLDAIPFGQPILVGHHSERADRNYRGRAWSKMDRAMEDAATAERMRSRADGIEAAAVRAIYRDDVDEVARLRERLAELVAERDAITAWNKAARAGKLTADDVGSRYGREVVSLLRCAPYQVRWARCVRPGCGVAVDLRRDAEVTPCAVSADGHVPLGGLPTYHASNLSGRVSQARARLVEAEARQARQEGGE